MGDERHIFLSTMPATRGDRKAALAVVSVSAVLFACAVPFAGVPLTPVPAFVASYQSALAINDLITAVLLFSQFAISRSRALLAAGERIFVHGAGGHRPRPDLSRPVRARRAARRRRADHRLALHGLARRISAAGSRLFVAERSNSGSKIRGLDRAADRYEHHRGCVTMAAFTWLVTAQHDLLPTLLSGGHYTPVMLWAVSMVWCLSLAALVTLWLHRPHSVLDVWLMVVMCAWMFDIALSSVLNVARFDVGFYLGRIYGLCAASFMLAVLLVEMSACRPSWPACSVRCACKPPRKETFAPNAKPFQRRRGIIERCHHHHAAGRHHYRLERRRRTPVRLLGGRSVRQEHQHHRPAGPPRRGTHIVERIRRGEPIEHFETARMRKDGSAVDVSLSISPIRSASGKVVGISKAARDITESKRTQQALSQGRRRGWAGRGRRTPPAAGRAASRASTRTSRASMSG